MTKILHNKIILITGASSGIGAETAKQLSELGAKVILLARNEKKLKKVKADINEKGGRAEYYVCDTGEAKEVRTVTEKIKNKFGIPDVLFNNAGSGKWRFIDESTYEDLENMVKAPILSAFYITKAFLPDMLKRDSGQIINVSSMAGIIPFSGATGYISTRKAIIGFHEALQYDLLGTNVKASLSYFAAIDSSFWSNNTESKERLPKSQKLIPVISVEAAAGAVVKGIIKKKTRIYTPFHLRIIEFLNWAFPPITRLVMARTGYIRKK